MSFIEFVFKLSETLDRLMSPSIGNSKNCAPKDLIELYSKLSAILERFLRLLIGFKRNFVSSSPIP